MFILTNYGLKMAARPPFAAVVWVGLSKQTVPNEVICPKSGEEPLYIAHFLLVLWLLEPFKPSKWGRNISEMSKIAHLAQSVHSTQPT